MKRNAHSLSNYHLFTCDMGNLVPMNVTEVLPGDTIQQSTSCLLRMSPLLAPVMHPVTVRIHHWFVPSRLLWDGFEDFITGGPDGTGSADPYPSNTQPLVVDPKSVGDYMRIPPRTYDIGEINMMPFRGYNMIFNEWYRDEDLLTELDPENQVIANCAWEKDYFTRSRPWAQKGPEVTLPLGSSAPVIPDASGFPLFNTSEATGMNMATDGGGSDNLSMSQNLQQSHTLAWNAQTGLEADLTGATSADVRAVRLAFALQRYQEARAQYGSRYTEYLRYLGIRPSDARLQRPEYLGGGKQTVAFSEVLRTGNVEAAAPDSPPVGEMKGHGIVALRSNKFRYFAEEHGYTYSLLSVRPRTMYQDGLHRMWSKRTKEDYYQKELELIGQQEVRSSEIFAQGLPADAETWSYADRYSEYRHQSSGISAEFRDLLDYWHLGRKFATPPTLNGSFVSCVPSKRIFAEQTQNSCWVMANHSIQARRMLGKRTIGKII